MNMQNLDLNLLKTLHILLEEENVSRAAMRLSLSQSAVSHALGRLRNYFGDPLLIKVKNGMSPTTLAEDLKVPLAKIIDQINELEMPFKTIKDDKNEIAIEWVSNKDKRKGILKREKVRKVIKFKIQLDPKS